MIRQAILILVISAVFGAAVNVVSPNKIPLVGKYRQLANGEGVVRPPDSQAGDPPFIDLTIAQLEFGAHSSIFVDARLRDEFDCGTIPGATNIPFEDLPEEHIDTYLDSALNHAGKDTPLIAFCSGEECDASLYLGRNLALNGYTRISIFFGGAREWEKAGLEMERRKQCGN
jgi:rhodanese-related sulfurtransferase